MTRGLTPIDYRTAIPTSNPYALLEHEELPPEFTEDPLPMANTPAPRTYQYTMKELVQIGANMGIPTAIKKLSKLMQPPTSTRSAPPTPASRPKYHGHKRFHTYSFQPKGDAGRIDKWFQERQEDYKAKK
jgi:hypothetical protein